MPKSIQDSQLDYLIGIINTELDNRVTKVTGKSLSTNDFSDEMKEKLNNIAAGAEVNQNAFTAIKFNEIGILADDKNDIMHITSGKNINFTVDEEGDSVVISATDVIVDDTLSPESENPIQNKVVNEIVDDLTNKINSKSTIYIQGDEPTNVDEGTLWIDTDDFIETPDVSWNDIVDKPFYEEPGILTIYDEKVLDDMYVFYPGANLYDYRDNFIGNMPVTEHGTYIVRWNDVEYKTTAFSKVLYDESVLLLGNLTIIEDIGGDTSVPFLIIFRNLNDNTEDNMAILWNGTDDDFNKQKLGIYQEGMIVHKIDPKYIPEISIDTSHNVNWNNITNRPFYEEEQLEYVINDITYDDFTYNESYNAYTSTGYVVHVLPITENNTYIVRWDRNDYECVAFTSEIDGYNRICLGNLSLIGQTGGNTNVPFLMYCTVYTDNTFINFVCLDGASSHRVGIYQNKIIIHKIDSKYLPNGDTDHSLSVEDMPADAKAVGDELASIKAQLAELLYKPIAISSFSLGNITAISSGNTVTTRSPIELGSTVTSVVLTWVTNKTPTTLKLDGVSMNANLTTHTYTNLNLTNSKTYKIVVTDEKNTSVEKSTTLTFCNRVCYGVAEVPDVIDSNFVMGLSTKNLATSKTNNGISYNAGAGQYLWYCVPVRLGTCSFTDVETGLGAGLALAATVSVTNASGFTEDYYVYKSDYAGLGSLTVKVT